MQFGYHRKDVSKVCEVCEEDAIVRQKSSEPDHLCAREKALFLIIVLCLQFPIVLVYSQVCTHTKDTSSYDAVLNLRCEKVVTSYCPRENLYCRSASPGFVSLLTVRFMGGKGFLDVSLQCIRCSHNTKPPEILFSKDIRCER